MKIKRHIQKEETRGKLEELEGEILPIEEVSFDGVSVIIRHNGKIYKSTAEELKDSAKYYLNRKDVSFVMLVGPNTNRARDWKWEGYRGKRRWRFMSVNK
mgnify:CR=1 FL=1